MSRFIEHVLCPSHEDSNPSCAVYDDGHYYCFVCGVHGDVSDLDITVERKPKDATNIEKEILRIKTLPHKEIRGLVLPYDDVFYYLVWPANNYFVKRYHKPRRHKYICPSGHRKPVYDTGASGTDAVATIIVEGEINAASIARCTDQYRVLSPGSASYLAGSDLPDLKGQRVCIIADADLAGAEGAILLSSKLEGCTKSIKLMEEDANDILVKYGPKELKKIIDDAVL